jgi:hypothetical protein
MKLLIGKKEENWSVEKLEKMATFQKWILRKFMIASIY